MYLGPGTYSHHTGKTYEVYGTGTNKDTEEEVVFYSRVDDEGQTLLFCRSRESFNNNAFHIINPEESEVLPKFRKSTAPEAPTGNNGATVGQF